MPIDHYHTIEKSARAELKERGSQFLAYAWPLSGPDEFKKHLKALKEEHPKAAHHCFAWRLGTDGTLFRASDDGEPTGTASKPILGQIDSKGLTDVGIVVVRYFGGTLLGVPGLIQAYRTAASLVLQLTPIVERPVLHPFELQFDYTVMNEVMLVVRRFHCVVLEQEAQLFCRLRLGVPAAEQEAFLEKIGLLYQVEVRRL